MEPQNETTARKRLPIWRAILGTGLAAVGLVLVGIGDFFLTLADRVAPSEDSEPLPETAMAADVEDD